MALTAEETAVIERWSGPIQDEAALEARLAVLGAPEVVALERLMSLQSEMMATVAKRGFGDERFDHTANMKWVDAQIAKLIQYLSGTDDVTLNAAAEALLESDQLSRSYTRTIAVDTVFVRRGG